MKKKKQKDKQNNPFIIPHTKIKLNMKKTKFYALNDKNNNQYYLHYNKI